jgi:hypothetical protein
MDSSQNKPKHTAYNLASSITQFMYKKEFLTYKICKTNWPSHQ